MGSNEPSSPSSPLHAIIFPFMSKGHTIPLLHLAHILLHRNLAVTVFTTPVNRPFVSQMLQETAATVIDLPFPDGIADIPAGVESTDKLPSLSLFHAFACATSLMKPHFEHALRTLPHVTFMVSDAFLWWTLDSASKFGFHRFVFYGMSNYAHAIHHEMHLSRFFSGPQPQDELVTLSRRFPWIRVSKSDFDLSFLGQDPKGAAAMFHKTVRVAAFNSYGRIVNSFYELEPAFADYVNTEMPIRSWSVGPLCLAARPGPVKKTQMEKPVCLQWLDRMLEEKRCVLYVSFGSQAEISSEQLEEIAIGLEESKVNFLWVMGKDVGVLPDGFEERVKGRGMVVREWVDQWEILMHECVEGFLSHCGWNSVLESICAGVPIVAWPMMADQYLNTRMVEEEMKVGLRVETCDGSVRGFVKWEGIKKAVKEVMEGEKGREAREKVRELAERAMKAVEEGGSSWSALNSLIHETCKPVHNTNGF